MKSIFFVLVLILGLTGCASTKVNTEVVKESRVIVVKIPSYLLNKCEVSKPIAKDLYIQLNAENKERELTNLIINLYSDIEKCNGKIINIKEFQDKIVKENEGKL